MCSHSFSYLTKSDYPFGRWCLTSGSKIMMPIISSGNGVKLETDMLVKILLEDFKNTAFSANKC